MAADSSLGEVSKLELRDPAGVRDSNRMAEDVKNHPVSTLVPLPGCLISYTSFAT